MRKNHEADSPAAAAQRVAELLFALGRTSGSLRDPIAQAFEAMRFTPAQIHALFWVGHAGQLTMGELARHLGITEKTVTGVVDRLERARLVRRERDGRDRRVVHVTLTPDGETVYFQMREQFLERLTAVLALLDRSDRVAAIAILEKLAHRLAASTSERVAS